MAMARDWNGMSIIERKNRAAGRAIVAMGMLAAADTKRLTHRISGTLARSVHAAEVGADHGADEETAVGADLMMVKGLPYPVVTPLGVMIEVGSWLPYACAEWQGRSHPGIEQGVEGIRGARSDMILRQAMREEGL